jgi:hypothetical protein
MIATRDIAIYGAVVSTAALLWTVGWALYKDAFRDRARIRVQIAEGHGVGAGMAPQPSLYLTVSNRGRRPVVIQSAVRLVSAKRGDREMLITNDLPKRLDESESAVVMANFGQHVFGSVSLKRWAVYDGAGRLYPLRERYRQRLERVVFAWPRRRHRRARKRKNA